jgi:O-antigen ligase
MSTEQLLFFFFWLLFATLGGAALLFGWSFLSARRQARLGKHEREPETPDISRRKKLAPVADVVAVAAAASIPWSTTATGILVTAWLGTAALALDLAELRRQALSPAGGLPLILVAMAVLGTAWADVSVFDRWAGLDGFLKLVFVPFLLAHFRHSERGAWVILAFLGASILLLAVSWGLVLTPGLPWRGKIIGVPVKDYISQSSIFTLCALALLGCALNLWRSGGRQSAVVLAILAAAFLANIAYVATSRTSLVVGTVLLLLLGFRSFGLKGMLGAAIVGGMMGGVFWASSPYLRGRVTQVVEEVRLYRTEHAALSSGLRLEFWMKSVDAVAKSPVIGNGTGSIPEMLNANRPAEEGAEFDAVNPHNQIFVVAIQLGFLGTMVLLAMWMAHLALFRGEGWVSWIGLVAVVQLICGSFFNSHLSDFTHGWTYVFAVGVVGGMVLRQSAPSLPVSLATAAVAAK